MFQWFTDLTRDRNSSSNEGLGHTDDEVAFENKDGLTGLVSFVMLYTITIIVPLFTLLRMTSCVAECINETPLI